MLQRSMILHRPAIATRYESERMFRPRSLAIIGSDGRLARQVLANIQAAGFAGDVQVVASGQTPDPADLAVITAESGDIQSCYATLARAGIFAGVALGMVTGLKEGQAATGVRVLGPGSFGIACPALHVNATLTHLTPRPGRVALVSQSAALCRAVLDWAEPNGVGFSQVVGIGGNAGTGFVQVLDFLSRDSGTGPILLDIRRIRVPRAFLSAARAAARLRPVVALRAGSLLLDPSGRAEMVFDAALNRAGVLTVSRFEDMLGALETLTRGPAPRSEGLAIVTNAIGPGQMAADAALAAGINLVPLAPETREVLRLAFPAGDMANIVYVGVDCPTRLAEAASLLAGAREVGGILAVLAPTGPADAAGVAALTAVPRTRVPLLVCAMGETTGAVHRRSLAEAGIPAFASPEQAVGGFRHLLRLRRARAAASELPSNEVLDLAPDRAAVQGLVIQARADQRTQLTPADLRVLFGAYGLARPPVAISVSDDPLFGPAIGVGSGEVAACAFDLPPLNLSLARGLVAHSPAASRLLPAQAEQLADLLVRVSQLIIDTPDLATLTLDAAADPAATLRPPGSERQLVLPPYPAALVGHWDAGGEPLTIRPIRPEDAVAHAALFSRITPADVRYRFFSTLRELSPERVARMTQVDYDREMAFIAVRANGDTVGVGRLVCEREEGEFAIIVQSDMKGTGLARHLMGLLIEWGRARGMTAISGQVLAENTPMLAFIRKLGFTLRRLPEEPDVVEARLPLNATITA